MPTGDHAAVTPALIAIAGPLKGAMLPLGEGEASIGRDETNWLSLDDLAVSRRHCLIRAQDDKYTLVDLESRNGTYVNSLPIREHLLQHGDEIKVGETLFLFMVSRPASSPVQMDAAMLTTKSTTRLRLEEARYLLSGRVVAESSGLARISRDLQALLGISAVLQTVCGLEDLAAKVLDRIFEIAPAERAVLLIGSDLSGLIFARNRYGDPNRPILVNRPIIEQVLKEGVAVLNTIATGPIRALAAAPLACMERIVGVLYVDGGDVDAGFDEDLLQLLTAIGAFAGMAAENVARFERLEDENRRLQSEINLEHDMVGQSAAMQDVYQRVARVAANDSTALLVGESGVGKELVARAIHRNSARAGKPFVAINCAALTDTLLESELFGYERGAFTGAFAQKKGQLELAEGGTLFLDEVGELALGLQAKLLRVLQEREFQRVGGTRAIPLDARLIAATNKDLEQAIAAGSFRQDLYFRLNVVCLRIPPLRERPDDIARLANHFVNKHSKRCKRQVAAISLEALAALTRYDWPGNVRELENAIERAVVLGSSAEIRLEDLPESVLDAGGGSPVTNYHQGLQEAQRLLISNALKSSNGNYRDAAHLLGVHPNWLHRLARRLNLKTPN